MSPALSFEDLSAGRRFRSCGRTVTEADIVAFAGISGDFNQLHINDLWTKENTPFEGRIAHGLLVLAISSGLATPELDDLQVVAWLQVERQMKAPTYPGDTIHVLTTVEEKRPSSSQPTMGVVTLASEVRNQRDEVVQAGRDTVMVARREAEEGVDANA